MPRTARISKQTSPPHKTKREQTAVWSVYLLRCADGTLYAGATNCIERRLKAHERGGVKYTRGRLPVVLAYLEEVGGRGAALSREAALKRLRRGEKDRLCRQIELPQMQTRG